MTATFDDPTTFRWTDEEITQVERPGYKVEIIDGGLHVTPPANEWHQEVEFGAHVVIARRSPTGWRVRQQRGIQAGLERFIPDVVVLVPGAPVDPEWLSAEYVALAVEVESRWTRRLDRGTKALIYAEAGIPAYWRVEHGKEGPIVHVYELPPDGDVYALVRSVRPGETYALTKPFPMTIDPRSLAEGLS